MTEPFGLGAIQSPPDERDFQIDQLASATGVVVAAPPPTFNVTKLPPVYNQHNTPMCVAYSDATEQAAFDLIELGHNYKWDFAYFFRLIGGTPNGAIVRNALAQRLHRGYPLLPSSSGNSMAAHKIAAYYSIPKTKLDVQQSLVHFGVLLVSTPWYNSWFYPSAAGVLPSPDYQVGGHAIAVRGYTASGIWLRNSWGTDWGVNGDCLMPWAFVLHSVWELWKAVDLAVPKVGVAKGDT